MSGILIAGIGNVFKGDDAFGVEVVARLAKRRLPDEVKVVDFGIRGIDLTYALTDDYDAAVMVDTMQRGEKPGTVSVIEPEPELAEDPADSTFSPHDLDPAKVLRLARMLGGACPRLLVIACEPLTFGDEDGAMGLSAPVAAALEPAVTAVEALVRSLLLEQEASVEETELQRSKQ
ncbi:MAG TPA: hydrogenase maturation protease [Rhizomicrobium sp.]